MLTPQSARRHQHNVKTAFKAQHVHNPYCESATLQLQQGPAVPVISCKASIARIKFRNSSFPLHHPHASVGLQLMQVQYRLWVVYDMFRPHTAQTVQYHRHQMPSRSRAFEQRTHATHVMTCSSRFASATGETRVEGSTYQRSCKE